MYQAKMQKMCLSKLLILLLFFVSNDNIKNWDGQFSLFWHLIYKLEKIIAKWKLINKITSFRLKSHSVDVPVRETQWDSVRVFAYIASLW